MFANAANGPWARPAVDSRRTAAYADDMVPQWVIEKKRDGHALNEADIRFFIEGYARGDLPAYQMSALAMAIYFQGMTDDEVVCLTQTMMDSGDRLDLRALSRPTADKHSTGGIGDKVSLLLAPLVACCGVAVPMISGRGLGITGGTLDKLSAIPGYRTDLNNRDFLSCVETCGCSIIGQTARLAPVDKKLYALRDVTGTVPSIPLIAASIMSKKLAEGAQSLVLDVKWGKGAFMPTQKAAGLLARTMIAIGTRMGRRMAALLTDMNQPLGRTVGNAVEVAETVAALQGHGPDDLMTVTLELAAEMLSLAGRAASRGEALERLRAAIDSGAAFAKLKDMVRLHGGDTAVLDDPSRLPRAAIRAPCPAPRRGYVTTVDAGQIGRACLVLGAGRQKVDDPIDPAVGIVELVKTGERVETGQPLAVVLANHPGRWQEARRILEPAFVIADEPAPPAPLITETIRPKTTSDRPQTT